MENNARKWAVTAAMAAFLAAALPAYAQSGRRVVLQVEYGVPPMPRVIRMMTMAQDEATRIYDAIGATLVWTDGSSPVGPVDDMRFTVKLLSDRMPEPIGFRRRAATCATCLVSIRALLMTSN